MAGGGLFSPTLKSMKEVTALRAQEWIHSEESAQNIPPANLLNPIGILKALRADRHSHSRARVLLRLRVPEHGPCPPVLGCGDRKDLQLCSTLALGLVVAQMHGYILALPGPR